MGPIRNGMSPPLTPNTPPQSKKFFGGSTFQTSNPLPKSTPLTPYPPPHPKFKNKSTFQTFSPLPKSEFKPLPYPLRTRSLEELRKAKKPTISFKTAPLSKSLEDLVKIPITPLPPKISQAWMDIGRNYASPSPEPANKAEETPMSSAEDLATPTTVTWITSSRTETATATTPAQKVRIYHILITLLTLAIAISLPSQVSAASTLSIWQPSYYSTKLCDLTLDIQNTNDTQDDILDIQSKVLEIRASPIENPDGHLKDMVFKFHTVKSLSEIAKLKEECSDDGNLPFAPLNFMQIANVLEFTENTLILDLQKHDEKYVIGPHRIEAPKTIHTIPDNPKFITFTQHDQIDVYYIAADATLNASMTHLFTCMHPNKEKKNTALLEASQIDFWSYSNILLDIIKTLIKNYNPFPEEEDCLPITFQPYKNTTFVPPPTYLTSSNTDQVLKSIKNSKAEMKKMFNRAQQLIDNRFDITRQPTSLWDLIYNFNLSLISHIMIFLLTNLLIFLMCMICCCLGACSYSRERTARQLLTSL